MLFQYLDCEGTITKLDVFVYLINRHIPISSCEHLGILMYGLEPH